MRGTTIWPIMIGLLCLLGFSSVNHRLQQGPDIPSSNFVAIPAPLLYALYMGDGYLASNIETARILISPDAPESPELLDSFAKLHLNSARLNPCHQDNYYIANSILAWAGLHEAASGILDKATDCRKWDDLPPFFNGFNSYYFQGKREKAIRSFMIAAERNPANRPAYTKAAILINAEQYTNYETLLNYLGNEYARTKDKRLKNIIARRIQRTSMIIELNKLVDKYEKLKGYKPEKASDLISAGLISELPKDPTRVGYIFDPNDHSFKFLVKLKSKSSAQ